MPDPIDPASATPPTETAKPGGIASMMAQLDAAAVSGDIQPPEAPKPPDDAPAPPAAKFDGEQDPLKPIVPAAPAKPADPAKPAKPAGDEMSVEDMEKFLKAHSNKKPWKVYESLKTTTAQKVAELESKLSALEKKPVEAPGDAAKVALLEKQIQALTGETKTYKERLAAADYIHTPKYEELRNKANRVWSKAVQMVTGMTVTDADGNARQATKEDFELIRMLPSAKRRQAARDAFGEDAIEVLGFVNQIDSIREENEEAQEAFAKTNEQTTLQRELESKGQQQKFESTYNASLEELKKNPTWGKWFAPDPADPEGTKLLADGFSEIEKVLALQETMSVEDAAAYAAVFRARAAAMPRLLLESNRKDSKIKALEEELKKYRASDPGSKGATGGGGATTEHKPKGIDGAVLAFDSDPSLAR